MAKDEHFIVISNSEDGDVRVSRVTRKCLLSLLAEAGVIGMATVAEENRGCSWDFANDGPRGMMIFPESALVEPKAKKVVETWEIP